MVNPAMWYALTALAILGALLLAGRLRGRRSAPIPLPAMELLPPHQPGARGVTVKLRPAPGAPNTDPPTDRHISERGTASIHRRTGRRSTTSV